MAKTITAIGFGIFWFFFMVTFVVSNIWAIGCLFGLIITISGMFYWEE